MRNRAISSGTGAALLRRCFLCGAASASQCVNGLTEMCALPAQIWSKVLPQLPPSANFPRWLEKSTPASNSTRRLAPRVVGGIHSEAMPQLHSPIFVRLFDTRQTVLQVLHAIFPLQNRAYMRLIMPLLLRGSLALVPLFYHAQQRKEIHLLRFLHVFPNIIHPPKH